MAGSIQVARDWTNPAVRNPLCLSVSEAMIVDGYFVNSRNQR